MTTVGLPRANPSQKDVDAAGVMAFLDDIGTAGLELHSLMIFRAGAVVAEGFWRPYAADRPHMQHSATKSWTAAAVGLALGEGRFGLTDRVIDFFPDHLPDIVSANLRAMTIEDLLTMRTGHATGISGGEWRGLDSSWIAAFLREPVAEPPGKTFIYSSASSYMLSAIVSKVTGQTVYEYLHARMMAPLGMGPVQWDLSPEGISTGGNGLLCGTEDVLKFGILHLQNGMWNGQQVLPAAWVREATRRQVGEVWMGSLDGRRYQAADRATAERREGYGYQWWMTPHDGYRASGVFGQQCIVLPDKGVVIAITAGLQNTIPRLMAAVWTHLYPAFGVAGDPAVDTALRDRLATLALPGPAGAANSPLVPAIDGRRIVVEPNEDGVTEIGLAFTAGQCVFTLSDGRGTHRIVAGLGRG
ncbi:serine hydrolase, partial [Acidisphaera sp. L21]|uniref:serine hydrolase domain-containing protein n=1 Tax=Acidisphaera sp. L21 TaxID=1641851 RepID=UPI00131E03CF